MDALWAFLEKCDSDAHTSGLTQILENAPQHLVNKTASQLRKRSAWLCLEEAREYKRASALNVMQLPSPSKRPTPPPVTIAANNAPSPTGAAETSRHRPIDVLGTLGRKDSFIGARRLARGQSNIDERTGAAKAAPTNEEVAQAVQEKVAAAVETQRKYKHVLWYSLFVAAYLIVLFLQASAYNSGEVVSTLRNALMPDGGMTATFQSDDDVLSYIGLKALLPTWKDPVCGDGRCEFPWEFPAWGRFGCKADCGQETQTTHILVQVTSNFVGHPNISPSVLMAAVSWNVCLADEQRRARGEADLCWFDSDQQFTEIEAVRLETMDVVDGNWYVNLMGDYAGRVSGNIYDLTNSTNPVKMTTDPVWEMCALPTQDTRSASVQAAGQAQESAKQEPPGQLDPASQLIADLNENAYAALQLLEAWSAALHDEQGGASQDGVEDVADEEESFVDH
ncbi:hypothetical protein WJX72_004431 [[Myrmecia] bisecta]|uniref:Uncharacterized protein n=1 Tax=[Myrmecia] bisecta TaxID=41462 RepID=A0AAW1P1R6_9CHLO